MAAFEVLALDTATPQIRAPGAGDTYTFPRAITPSGANVTPFTVSGYSLTGANAQSMFDLSGTWNTTGTPTAIKLNITDTASNASSLLMDLQVGGSTRFNVRKDGTVNLSTNAPYINVPSGFAALQFGGTNVFIWQSGAVRVNGVDLQIGGTDTVLTRDAANTLAQRNGVNAQTKRIYNTYTDASNYERGKIAWNGNVLEIGPESAGTGSARVATLFLSSRTDQYITGSTDGYTASLQTRYGQAWTTSNQGVVFPLGIALTSGEGRGLTIISQTWGAAPTYANANNVGDTLFRVGNAYGTYPNGASIKFLASYGTTPSSAGNGGYGGSFKVWVGQGGTPNGAGSNGADGGFEVLRVDRSGTIGTSPIFRIDYSGSLTIGDAADVILGTTTGTKIGTATTQKLGFWNATPIVQPTTAVAAATVAATGAGDVVAASTTFDGYTIPQIVKALRNAGLLA